MDETDAFEIEFYDEAATEANANGMENGDIEPTPSATIAPNHNANMSTTLSAPNAGTHIKMQSSKSSEAVEESSPHARMQSQSQSQESNYAALIADVENEMSDAANETNNNNNNNKHLSSPKGGNNGSKTQSPKGKIKMKRSQSTGPNTTTTNNRFVCLFVFVLFCFYIFCVRLEWIRISFIDCVLFHFVSTQKCCEMFFSFCLLCVLTKKICNFEKCCFDREFAF